MTHKGSINHSTIPLMIDEYWNASTWVSLLI